MSNRLVIGEPFEDAVLGGRYVRPVGKWCIESADLPMISLFTGCGGMDIGLEVAGFRTAACVEIDQDCWKTIRLNRQLPDWPILEENGVCGNRKPGDIVHITTADILKAAGLRRGEAALVTGGAPCQPFSNIGKKEGTDSEKGNLFHSYMRVVAETEPKAFIFENVQGMNQRKHREVIDCIRETSASIGYAVTVGTINTANYGVPQRRKRLIVLGLRNDCCNGVPPAFPYPTHAEDPSALMEKYGKIGLNAPRLRKWVTVRECFRSISPSEFERPDCIQMKVSDEMAERIKWIKVGTRDNFKALPSGLRPECWKDKTDESGRPLGHQGGDTFGRLESDKPSVTIRTCGYHPMKGRYLHPTENRGLNTIEMARLQGFPPEWRFHGGLISVGRQIGNAVPPPLARALGKVLIQFIRDAD